VLFSLIKEKKRPATENVEYIEKLHKDIYRKVNRETKKM
jgi:hypothetical protein